ncbi:MAG TPA: ribosome maturation factor RimP [Gemmatirosa sp.]
MSDLLEPVVLEAVAALGFELVELRRRGSRSRPVLDVRVERADGSAVTIDDCARASRAIEARLDDEPRIVGDQYVLEVSSPGVERPLRRPDDWRRFAGQPALVTAAPLPGGRAEVTLVALEGEPGAEVAVVRDARGAEHQLPLGAVTQARLAFHWNSRKE